MLVAKNTLKSFETIITSHATWKKVYNNLGSPRPFDVTLRDGLQNVSKENLSVFSLKTKQYIYKDIVSHYNPISLEVGSIVSPHVLPIFKDSIELFTFCEKQNKTDANKYKYPHFLLVPSKNKLKELMLHSSIYCDHFSFITSVSNSFQQKNTNKTLNENRLEIESMIQLLEFNTSKQIKLYISCINECPIEGKINNDTIVEEIMRYNCSEITSICLSDTMGSLEPNDFTYIVDKCNRQGVPYSKLSLHLHVQKERIHKVKSIFYEALDRKIIHFDVSALETGGCSVTMKQNQMAPNLSYDQYYSFLIDYMENY